MKSPDSVLRALADPTRRTVFERLRGGPRSVGELAEGLPVSRPAVSQHLRALKDAGLVREQACGTRHFYEVDPGGLQPLALYVDEFWGEILSAFSHGVAQKNGGRNEH